MDNKEELQRALKSLKKEREKIKKVFQSIYSSERICKALNGELDTLDKEIKEIEREIEALESMKQHEKIEVMLFLAEHHHFSDIEVIKIAMDLQRFSKPYSPLSARLSLSDVDDNVLFGIQLVPATEARRILDALWEIDNCTNTLFYWDGIEISKAHQ